MAIFGPLGSCGHVWQLLGNFLQSFWPLFTHKYLVTLPVTKPDHTWHLRKVSHMFGPFCTFSQLLAFKATFATHCWQISRTHLVTLPVPCRAGSLQTTFYHFSPIWKLLAMFGNFRPFSATFGHFLQLLAIFGSFWPFWATFGKFCPEYTWRVCENLHVVREVFPE